MKTFETEKHNIPEGATHYANEKDTGFFIWYREDTKEIMVNGYVVNQWEEAGKDEDLSDLEPIPTETPEEKEAIDAIEQVEWNGEGLPPVGGKVVIRYMYDSKTVCHYGVVLYASESHCILDINGKECHYLMCDYQYEKPETPEAKKEREELEAAYDLRCTFNEDDFIISFDEFKNHHSSIREKWLKIVRKTGYRKGE